MVEQLCERWGIGPKQRTITASPRALGSAAHFVSARFPEFVRRVRSARYDPSVGGLVVLDGDEKGLLARRDQLTRALKDSGEAPLDPEDPRFAVVVPCWHIETWVAWLCGHRPVDEATRYKATDERGREVGRRIESGEYSVKRAIKMWAPAADDEALHLPALSQARRELRRLGLVA